MVTQHLQRIHGYNCASLQLQVCKCVIKTFMFCLLTEYTHISEEERV